VIGLKQGIRGIQIVGSAGAALMQGLLHGPMLDAYKEDTTYIRNAEILCQASNKRPWSRTRASKYRWKIKKRLGFRKAALANFGKWTSLYFLSGMKRTDLTGYIDRRQVIQKYWVRSFKDNIPQALSVNLSHHPLK